MRTWALKEGEHLGYQWAVTHNEIGFRCGYVLIPEGHPWHGKHYDQITANAHGGLTFASDYDGGFWIGFDCAHCHDAPDPDLPTEHDLSRSWKGGTIRTTEYVEAECKSLIDQAILAAAFTEEPKPQSIAASRTGTVFP